MAKLGDIIVRLLPNGTRPAEDEPADKNTTSAWALPPVWPPDLFAVCATLVRLTEAYTHGDVRGGVGLSNHVRDSKHYGGLWAHEVDAPALTKWLEQEWRSLVSAWSTPVARIDGAASLPAWVISAIRLMATADEACVGVGFGSDTTVAKAAIAFATRSRGTTLCHRVDKDEACVQPKGRTPPVGCNLRSMSLHLALLPPASIVSTVHLDPEVEAISGPLGVLLVPFPYVIQDSEFVGVAVAGGHWGHLRLRKSWGEIPGREVADFVADLVSIKKTAIVVLPELALNSEQLKCVCDRAFELGVRMVIAGVHSRGPGLPGMNRAVGTLRSAKAGVESSQWQQAKHHRWRVESLQIANYGLPLDPKLSWWEDIDISQRQVFAARFAAGSTVACLVCEDLARVEPVQPALREMGASLIVALLMDGPQYVRRWAAKASTVFADDPGSSVLALTSLGLVRRNQEHRERHSGNVSIPIALWQEPGKGPVEVALAPGALAVHFNVRIEEQRETTLDGRDDGAAAEVVRLDVMPEQDRGTAFTSLSHPLPPGWATPLYRAG